MGPESYNTVGPEMGLVKRSGIYENVVGAQNCIKYQYIIPHSFSQQLYFVK